MTPMTKEEILERLKDAIITLAKKDAELKSNESLRLKWAKNYEKIHEAIDQLDSCDMDWLSSSYTEWFNTDQYIQSEVAKRKDIIRIWSGGF
jgi:hypothetical protein